MENTQSFNTPRGIKVVRNAFQRFSRHLKQRQFSIAARDYDRMYQATFLFPPCNVVNSLRDDLELDRTQNVIADVQVIADMRNKIKY